MQSHIYNHITGKGKGRGKGKSNKSESNNDSEQLEESIVMKHLYNCRLAIPATKYKDLVRLCDNGTIPKRFHTEYKTLPYNSMLQETLNETDEADLESE